MKRHERGKRERCRAGPPDPEACSSPGRYCQVGRCCYEGECDRIGWLLGLLLLGVLLPVLWRLIRWIGGELSGESGSGETGVTPSQTHKVPPSIYRRPDPFIYDQYYLAKLGYAVTWHNPDVRLEDPLEVVPPGQARTAVDSSALEPGKTYDVIARIWNASTSAPAAHLPVSFSYLAFGIGTVKNAIGTTHVNLSVKGGSACPAYARQKWTTPVTPGHYCLQVELIWPDDVNPANNLGQHNTDVRPLNSPNADFAFPLRNDADFAREFELEVDAYRIGELPECEPAERGGRAIVARSGDRPALPDGWTVDFAPHQVQLAPGEQTEVTVHVTAPDGFTGLQAINVHALAGHAPAGGVTLYVHG